MAAPATFRVRVEDLRLLPNIPAGMDFGVVGGMLNLLRTTCEDHVPILVRRDGDGWRILDGRYRFMAAVVAGRPDVLAVEEIAEHP